MYKTAIFILLVTLTTASCAQQGYQDINPILIGGPCEGCEAVLEYEERQLYSVDTLPMFERNSPKIKVYGTVYQPDGKTPAEGVILYVYHTDREGIYPTKGVEKGWAKKHGFIRQWLRTDEEGNYAFYTFKPNGYPSGTEPAHIHLTVLEPEGKYYWLGSYHFTGDSLLTANEINPENPRGGTNGLLNLTRKGNILVDKRDIILGKNVQGYD